MNLQHIEINYFNCYCFFKRYAGEIIFIATFCRILKTNQPQPLGARTRNYLHQSLEGTIEVKWQCAPWSPPPDGLSGACQKEVTATCPSLRTVTVHKQTITLISGSALAQSVCGVRCLQGHDCRKCSQ